jgi:hypothetical protein
MFDKAIPTRTPLFDPSQLSGVFPFDAAQCGFLGKLVSFPK